MKNQSITEAMLQFIEESPTAFHAAANVEALLLENGFEKLENLAEGSRLIGIISHVSELKERIGKKILVTKNRGQDGVGSIIEVQV